MVAKVDLLTSRQTADDSPEKAVRRLWLCLGLSTLASAKIGGPQMHTFLTRCHRGCAIRCKSSLVPRCGLSATIAGRCRYIVFCLASYACDLKRCRVYNTSFFGRLNASVLLDIYEIKVTWCIYSHVVGNKTLERLIKNKDELLRHIGYLFKYFTSWGQRTRDKTTKDLRSLLCSSNSKYSMVRG